MKKIGFLLIIVFLSNTCVIGQQKFSQEPRKYVIDTIEIVVTPKNIFVMKRGKKMWENSDLRFYPNQSEVISKNFLFARGVNDGPYTRVYGIIFDIYTGKIIYKPWGNKLLQNGNNLYFDNTNKINDFMVGKRGIWGSLSIFKFDVKSGSQQNLQIFFPEDLIPTNCIDLESSGSLQYLKFKKRTQYVWYYTYESNACSVLMSFPEKSLIARIILRRKR